MEPRPTITDLQYFIYECGATVEDAAKRTGCNPARILEELARTPVPEWLRESAQQWAKSFGTAS